MNLTSILEGHFEIYKGVRENGRICRKLLFPSAWVERDTFVQKLKKCFENLPKDTIFDSYEAQMYQTLDRDTTWAYLNIISESFTELKGGESDVWLCKD